MIRIPQQMRRMPDRAPALVGRLLPSILAGVVCLGTLVAQPCRAQDEYGYDEEEMGKWIERVSVEQPTIRQREVDEIARFFGFDDDIRSLLESLHKGYSDEFLEGAAQRQRKMRDMMRRSGEFQTGDMEDSESESYQEVIKDWTDFEENWRHSKTRLKESFYANVQALLSQDQLAQWPRYQRDCRRRESLHVGAFFHSEAVDLVRLVDELDLDESTRAQVDPTLDAYATDLDTRLQKRMDLQDVIRKAQAALMTGEGEAEAMMDGVASYTKNLRDVINSRMAIRDVNVQYRQMVASSIPGDKSEEFARRWQRASFPAIYEPTVARKYIDELLDRDDIEPSQREGLELVLQSHDFNVNSSKDQLARIETEIEDTLQRIMNKDTNGMLSMMIGQFSAMDDEAMTGMFDFDVKSIFTDDQQETRRNELLASQRQFVRAAIEQAHGILSSAQQTDAPMPTVPDEPEGEELRKQMREQMRNVMDMMEQFGDMDF